jgi:hypothetical protein
MAIWSRRLLVALLVQPLLPIAALCPDAAAEEEVFHGLMPGISIEVSMECAANSAKETKPVIGPRGLSATLIVASDDDHSKESHDCSSGYHIRAQPDPGLKDQPYDGFFGNDAGWSRMLSGKLYGISQDGTSVFGAASETGAHAFTIIFAYQIQTGSHVEVDVTKKLRLLKLVKCGSSFAVIGTTTGGRMVIEPATVDRCHTKFRWSENPKTCSLQRLHANAPITPLYKTSASNE